MFMNRALSAFPRRRNPSAMLAGMETAARRRAKVRDDKPAKRMARDRPPILQSRLAVGDHGDRLRARRLRRRGPGVDPSSPSEGIRPALTFVAARCSEAATRLLLQLAVQPGPCGLPVRPDRVGGGIRSLCDLLFLQAAEAPEFHHLRFAKIDGSKGRRKASSSATRSGSGCADTMRDRLALSCVGPLFSGCQTSRGPAGASQARGGCQSGLPGGGWRPLA